MYENLLNHFLSAEFTSGLGKSILLDTVIIIFKVLLTHCMLPILLKCSEEVLGFNIGRNDVYGTIKPMK